MFVNKTHYVPYSYYDPKPPIIAAAIWYKPSNEVFFVDIPGRHHNVLQGMKQHIPDMGRKWDQEVQGFITIDMQFVTRKQAYKIAKANGQFKRDTSPGRYNGDELYSEDLW